ncbi:MAG: hypothetical protein JWM90_2972 [Thermoleophilia bacterium]|nr:hypothetical protein [Thermoleophilia bacterium]
MALDDSERSREASPTKRRAISRRTVKLLVLAELAVLLLAVGAFILLRGDDETNVVNAGLRGSLPPQDQVWPDLSDLQLVPPAPSRKDVAGGPAMLVATCLECRSGDLFGGFLARLTTGDLPANARVVVVGWEGEAAAWRAEWRLGPQVEVHVAETPETSAQARLVLRTGESGSAFLHDPTGGWRATYASGQLDVEDVRHDLEQLGSD